MKFIRPGKPSYVISSFRLLCLIRQEDDPVVALRLFKTPNKDINCGKPFPHSMSHYGAIVRKLARARMSKEIEQLLSEVKANFSLFPYERFFCYLIAFYSQIRRPDSALKLFHEIPEYRCQRTIKSLNSLVEALMICKEYDTMKKLLMSVDEFGVPDAGTYNILIKWSCKGSRFGDAMMLFEEMLDREIKPNKLTYETLMYWLCTSSRIDDAFKLKNSMKQLHNLQPDARIYRPLIKGLCNSGKLDVALEMKDEMLKENLNLGAAIYSTLMNELLKSGRCQEIDRLLEEMRAKGLKMSHFVFNVMIHRACIEEKFDSALKILEEMNEKGFAPDKVSYHTILGELCKNGKVSDAYELFEDMPRRGFAPTLLSYRIIFDGLLEAMRFQDAFFVLDEMVSKGFEAHCTSVDEFLYLICYRNCNKLVRCLVQTLSKANLLNAKRWRIVINMVVKDCNPCVDFLLVDF